MGYFNIFYKITRIIDMLTRKRNRKFIVAILVIIGIIFLLHNKGYCAQEDSTYTTDTSYFILSEYDAIMDNFKLKFMDMYFNSTQFKSTFDLFFQDILNGKYPYFNEITNQTTGDRFYRINFYDGNYTRTIFDTSLVYNDYTRVPSSGFNITIPSGTRTYALNLATRNFSSYLEGGTPNIAVPQILLFKIPKQLIDCMSMAGFIYSDSANIVDIKEVLEEQNNKLNTINDSITDTDYNENVVDVDTSAVDSMSDTEVNGLFSTIVSNFNNSLSTWNGTTSIIFYIPFTNGKYISIPDNIVSSKLPTQFLDLVHAFWYFVFGLYLFRFINNLIKKIRSGDILDGYSNDNEVITSNML